MHFRYLNIFAILMAVIVLIATVSGQHDPGHDPDHPGHDPHPHPKPSGSIIGQCCSATNCGAGCNDVSGTPNVATKHNLPANCKSFSGASSFGTICGGKDCSSDCSSAYVPAGNCVTADAGRFFGCVIF